MKQDPSFTYQQWLDRYFKKPKQVTIFYKKDGSEPVTEEQAKAMYQRMYCSHDGCVEINEVLE